MTVERMREGDRTAVVGMMRAFYATPAVHSDGSEEIFAADVDACVGESPFLDGYVVREGEEYRGYAMVAKSFSTEFGKRCAWLEDLYVCPSARGRGLGGKLLAFLEKEYDGYLLRLEVDEENEGAQRLYRRFGFEMMPYTEMKKDTGSGQKGGR